MELRHLRYFVALAEELSFTRAAERVHVTQSTLSHQIKQLEDELGQKLFERTGKRVVMTEVGETLLVNATKALREIDDGIRAVRGTGAVLSGSLIIGATHTFNLNLIPACLAVFMARHPTVIVTVRELAGAQVETELQAGSIDIGIAYRPTRELLAFEPLYLEEMVLAVGKNHPLAARRRIRLAELHRQPLVLPTKGSTTRQILDESFATVGAEPAVAAEVDSVFAMLGLVRRTEVGAIISEQAAAGMDQIRTVPLESPTPLRIPGILLKQGRPLTAAERSFIAIVRRTVIGANLRRPNRQGNAAGQAKLRMRVATI